jgi:putative FmdB family regulatory protein
MFERHVLYFQEVQMPVYQYQCDSCGENFERLFMSPEDRPEVIPCPACESTEVHRVFSAPTVHTSSGENLVDQVAQQATEEKQGRPQAFDQHDLNEALKKR